MNTDQYTGASTDPAPQVSPVDHDQTADLPKDKPEEKYDFIAQFTAKQMKITEKKTPDGAPYLVVKYANVPYVCRDKNLFISLREPCCETMTVYVVYEEIGGTKFNIIKKVIPF